MKTAIVGYSGFVGTNLCESHEFTYKYNSKNINEAFGLCPDLLVYSGVPAAMFLANNFPEKDLEVINQAIENIKAINPKRLVLISTIAVLDNYDGTNEDFQSREEELPPYGRHRLLLEKMVRRNYPDALIVRLPALFGLGLKKNFVYDLIHPVPMMLKSEKYQELLAGSEYADDYENLGNGFYKLISCDHSRMSELEEYFKSKGFTASNFTDSRSEYQFFDLSNLWNIINKALKSGIKLLNICSEPIRASELYRSVEGRDFSNEILQEPIRQNVKSVYATDFGGKDGYMYSKEDILKRLEQFIKDSKGLRG